MNECVFLGGAINIGQKKQGTERAPQWLRDHGLLQILKRKFLTVHDLGDHAEEQSFAQRLDITSKLYSLADYSKRFGEMVYEHLNKDRFVLNIGGDHSLAVGTMAGSLSYNSEIKIIWVDAHADINTPKTSPTMNTHGMPLALAIKHQDFDSFKNEFAFLSPLSTKNIVYIGLRDVDPGEQKILDEKGIKHYTAKDVQHKGIKLVMKEALHYLDPQETCDFHLSLDVDGVDPEYFPSTGTPVERGLELDEAQFIVESLSRTGRLRVMDLVELNPYLGDEIDVALSGKNALSLIESIHIPSIIGSPREASLINDLNY
jgi:arginase